MDISLSAWLLVFAYGLAILALAIHFNRGDSDVRTVRKIVEQHRNDINSLADKFYNHLDHSKQVFNELDKRLTETQKFASVPKAPRPIEITIIKRNESNGIKKENDTKNSTKIRTTSSRQNMAK